jgi:hypothetical protein
MIEINETPIFLKKRQSLILQVTKFVGALLKKKLWKFSLPLFIIIFFAF